MTEDPRMHPDHRKALSYLQEVAEEMGKLARDYRNGSINETFLEQRRRRCCEELYEFLAVNVSQNEADKVDSVREHYDPFTSDEERLALRCEALAEFAAELHEAIRARPERIYKVKTSSAVVSALSKESPNSTTSRDMRKVFVIHGRNSKLRKSMFTLLRDMDLDPKEWETLVTDTKQGFPHNLEVVRRGLDTAAAIVALWTAEDFANLRGDLSPGEAPELPTLQPRPNVLLETGLALALKMDKVIVVRVGKLRGASDLDGLNYLVLQDGPTGKDFEARKKLHDRLQSLGAAVNTVGRTEYLTAGDFVDDPPVQGALTDPVVSGKETSPVAVPRPASDRQWGDILLGFPVAATALEGKLYLRILILGGLRAFGNGTVQLKPRLEATLFPDAFPGRQIRVSDAENFEDMFPEIDKQDPYCRFVFNLPGPEGMELSKRIHANPNTMGLLTSGHIEVEKDGKKVAVRIHPVNVCVGGGKLLEHRPPTPEKS
jgi:predicted nucleotide-binding protein